MRENTTDDEEKLLLAREYEKYLKDIETAETRERHYHFKEIGYNEAFSKYGEDLEYLGVIFGFISETEIDTGDFIDLLSSIKMKIDIKKFTKNILKNKTKELKEIKIILNKLCN
ncbi:hypothetical protein NGRA_1836 [Nosema granulosis]|uniref:Uncharacterized protein n=1 Tax=Nosema granulosis TaxID=83296 RepID=A0A9P6GXS0_9MICR|nr:hypothetical protein NGRA_1836 [Nosema granulosis]